MELPLKFNELIFVNVLNTVPGTRLTLSEHCWDYSLLNMAEGWSNDLCRLYSSINDAFPRKSLPWGPKPPLTFLYPNTWPLLTWDRYSGRTRWLSTLSPGSSSHSVPMGPWPCVSADRLAIHHTHMSPVIKDWSPEEHGAQCWAACWVSGTV